jgi:arylsulfatase A-like enzyme
MPKQPPNVLWIVTTQWRAQATGYGGDANAQTPFLDSLAKESVDFSQAVTPHPFGPFARAALLTGIPCPENGIRDYFDPLPADSRTVAKDMEDRAYGTLFFGKWHLSARSRSASLVGEEHARTPVPPQNRGGFAFWEGFESGFQLNDPWLHGTRLPEPVRFPGYQSDVLCTRALEALASRQNPWFAVVSLEAPHPPYQAPASGIAPSDPEALELRANVRPGAAAARARSELAGYYAHIRATDRAIGRLVSGLPNDTAIVFTSVHGDMHGSHGLFRKGWPHEESVRVPLLVRGLGAARRDEGSVSLVDLPSITRALADGTALPRMPEMAQMSMPSVVELPDQCDRVWAGVRSRSRKYVQDAKGEPWLLFDLENDPLETVNLAADPALAAECSRLAQQVSWKPAGRSCSSRTGA